MTYEVLLDLDLNSATGCTVATAKGDVNGIDQSLVTTVTTTPSGGSVSSVSRRACSGGVLGSPVAVDAGGWAVGFGNGTLGTAVIETYVPRELLAGATQAGIGVVSTSGAAGDAIVGAGGILPVTSLAASAAVAPTQIPLLSPWALALLAALVATFGWRAAQRSNAAGLLAVAVLTTAAAGIVWAATVILDGQVGDWNAVPAAATDAKGNAPQNADLVALYAQNDAARVYFRIDADVVPDVPANVAPVIDAGTDQTINLPATASLDGTSTDDGLPNPPGAVALSWTKVSGPGTVTFTSPSAVATNASFSAAGVYVLRLTGTDGALSTSDDVQVTVNPVAVTNQAPTVDAGADQTITLPASANLTGSATDDGLPNPPAALTLGWSKVSGPGTVTFGNAATAQTTATFSQEGTYVLRLTANDGALGQADDVQVTVNPEGALPALVAPPLDQTVATTVGGSTAFLYTGPNAVQTGVAPGTIEERRAAVVRGKVLTRAGDPLSGVVVTILGRPEFGQTQTRADGVFDMAVNGGGPLTVNYAATGLLTVQRQVNVPWQDFAIAPDVVMTPLDTQVSTIAANAPAIQVHQGSPVADADGSRKAVLMFPSGTTTLMVLPNGTTQPLLSFNVRATEYTVGPQGPSAMPAALPANTAYTYAVELSVDEAIAAGAIRVEFSQPVVNYVENFLGLPVGTAVPSGYYDRLKAAWVASDNGRIVRVTGITGGLADVDTIGSGSLPALALTDAERQQLASLYAVGTTLWRVPVSHFTPWDYNFPWGAPADADDPADLGARVARTDAPVDGSCQKPGSVIECESRVLGEAVDLPGTPYSLHYRSNRVAGYGAAVDLQLSGPTLPPSLSRIEVRATIAGRVIERSFSPLPNRTTRIEWDGTDVYGRPAQGGQWITGTIDYVFPLAYLQPGEFAQSFDRFGGPTVIGVGRQRSEFRASMPFRLPMREGIADARGMGLGGWTLDAHHFYDPTTGVLDLGNGTRRRAEALARVVTTVAGSGTSGFSGDGGQATLAQLSVPSGIAFGADGSLYIADQNNRRVRRVATDGKITTVAGNGSFTFSGDGGLATQAGVSTPRDVAVGPDGRLYIADGNRIRRVGPDGIIVTVAGNGQSGSGGDGGPATQASLSGSLHIDLGPDGSLYIADQGFRRIRRVGPDGIITTAAGTGLNTFEFNGDGLPATQSNLISPADVTVAPDGSLYIADNVRVRRVGTDGIMRTVAGSGNQGYNGDGIPATQANLSSVSRVAFGPDGSFYFGEAITPGSRIRRVSPDGIISTVAGTGGVAGFNGDGQPATQTTFFYPEEVEFGPLGDLFVADQGNYRIRRIGPPLPGFTTNDIAVASEDGRLLYRFDENGRHLQTVDALAGGVLREFVYDGAGRLIQAIEKTGGTDEVTTIERDAAGNSTAIVGPYGKRITLTLDGNGFLASLANAAAETTSFLHTSNGLLASKTAPGNRTTTFTYDGSGRLTRDTDPVGGAQELAHAGGSDAFAVTLTTPLGRSTSYGVERLPDRAIRRTITSPDGTTTTATDKLDAGIRVLATADGTNTTSEASGDPRVGMVTPVAKSVSIQLPSTLQLTQTSARAAALSDPTNPLSLITLTETASVNGRTTTSTYTAATRTNVIATPAGRTLTTRYDALGRVTNAESDGLAPSSYTYDARGRLATVTQGSGAVSRSYAMGYDAQGLLQSITDPLGRTMQYARDAVGRVTRKTLPDGSTVGFAYDAAGGLVSVTPPGRPSHVLGYSARGELTSIVPPTVAGSGPTLISYNADRQLTQIVRPGGEAVAYTFDGFGRLTGQTLTNVGLLGTAYAIGYDSAGRITSLAGPGGQGLGFSYDGSLLAAANWSGPVVGTIAWTYDSSFRVTGEAVGGSAIAYTYDADDRVTQVGPMSVTRNAQSGQVESIGLGAVTDSFTRNQFGEVVGHTVLANGSLVFAASFTRNAIGWIVQKQETVGGATATHEYAYDSVGQLTSVRRDGSVVESYVYDTNGNRTSGTIGGATRTATFDAQDRIVTEGAATYAFTPAGRLASRTQGGATTTYSYDAMGNLLEIASPSGTVITYQVDPLNRRVAKSVNGSMVRRFLHAGLRLLAEVDAAGSVLSRFVFAGGAVPVYMVKGGVTYRIVIDRNGSVRLVIDTATGAIAQRLDYDGFGNVTLDTNPGFQPFGFAGGLYDSDTGLVRFGARDYDPALGRWTAKDPIGFAGGDTNLYRYVGNNPVMWIDPAGSMPDRLDDDTAEIPAHLWDPYNARRYEEETTRAAQRRQPRRAQDNMQQQRDLAASFGHPADRGGGRRGFSTPGGSALACLASTAILGAYQYFRDDIRDWTSERSPLLASWLDRVEHAQDIRAAAEAYNDELNRPFREAHPFLYGFLQGFGSSPVSSRF